MCALERISLRALRSLSTGIQRACADFYSGRFCHNLEHVGMLLMAIRGTCMPEVVVGWTCIEQAVGVVMNWGKVVPFEKELIYCSVTSEVDTTEE